MEGELKEGWRRDGGRGEGWREREGEVKHGRMGRG